MALREDYSDQSLCPCMMAVVVAVRHTYIPLHSITLATSQIGKVVWRRLPGPGEGQLLTLTIANKADCIPASRKDMESSWWDGTGM